MAVRLRMELDADQSIETLDKLKSKLGEVSATADEAATSFGGLNQQFEAGVPVTAEANKEFSDFHDRVSVVVKGFDLLEQGVTVASKSILSVGKTVKEVGEFALEHKKVIALAAKEYYGWNSEQIVLGAGLRSLIGSITGLGAAVSVAYVYFKAWHGALAATGKVFVDVETGLETTNKAFLNFAQEAQNYGKAVTEYIDRSGNTMESFGVRVESNLDRMNKASKKFVTEVGRNFDGFGTLFRTHIVEPVSRFTERQWKDFDERVTLGAKDFVTAVNAMTDAWREFRIHTDAAWTDGDSERARRQADALDAARAATDKLTAANEKNRESFERLRGLRGDQEAAPAAQQKAKDLAGPERVAVTDYSREQATIDRLKQVQKMEEGLAAQRGEFDEEALKRSQRIWDILDERQARLDAQKKASFDAGIKRIQDELAKANEVRAAEIHEEMIAQQKEIDERKRMRDQAIKEEENARLETIRRNLAAAKEAIREQAKAEEEAARARQSRIKELSTQYGGGMRAADAVKSQRDIQTSANRELAQLHQQMIQQYVTGDVRGFMDSARKQVEIKQNALKAMRELENKFSKDGGLLEQIKGGLSDDDKLNQVTKNRQRDAVKDLVGRKENQKAFADLRRANQGAELTDEEQQGVARLRHEADKLEKRIKAQTRRDANRGKIGEDEVVKAEGDLVKSTVDSAAKSGKFSDEAVAGMKDAAKVQQQQAEKVVQNQKELAAVREQLAEVSRMLQGEVNGGSGRAKRK